MNTHVRSHNRDAWDKEVERGNIWTTPVSSEEVKSARSGTVQVKLTCAKYVPHSWFPDFRGLKILALASGGGQQGPLFAAAGAEVTVFDNSPRQLAQDRMVAEREGLHLEAVEGDMADLSLFPNESFDLIFNPVSNCFVESVRPVWKECARVLKKNGHLLTGFINPVLYSFDFEQKNQGVLRVKYSLPYSDLHSLTDEERIRYTGYGTPLEFSHTLTDQISGQLEAGLVLTDFYEDGWGGEDPTDKFFSSFIATRARKL